MALKFGPLVLDCADMQFTGWGGDTFYSSWPGHKSTLYCEACKKQSSSSLTSDPDPECPTGDFKSEKDN